MQYRFNDFTLDTEAFELRRGETRVHVEPLVFDLLRFFVTHPDRVLSRDEIIADVWRGRFVSDATVSGAIKAARKALGDTGEQQSFIRTVRGRGFQFVANVRGAESQETVVTCPAQPSEPESQSAITTPPRIAVLPFFPLSNDAELRLLGDAVAQEVILELSRLHWLFVVARGSSFQFRGLEVDLDKAGEILGATYIVTGSIAKAGANCVVTVELCQVEGGKVIWADRYDVAIEGLMHMRTELAGKIVGALEPRIQLNEALQAAKLPTQRLDAWAAYHRGLWHMYRFTDKDNDLAAELFSHATALDPNFARAHAGLSFTHFQRAFLGFTDDLEGERRRARALADRSMELDPLDPFVNLTMGRSEWILGNLETGLSWMERSIALSPNYAFAIYNSALVGTLLGDGATNEPRVAHAIALSPIDPLNYAMLATRAMTFVVRDEFDTAADWADRAVRAPNAHIQIFAIAAFSNELAGRRAQAKSHIAQIRNLNPAYSSADFLKAFPLQPKSLRDQIRKSMSRLGI